MTVLEKIEETYQEFLPYINEEPSPLLLKMCNHCEEYCGEEHDYSNCKDKACFTCYLAYQRLEWEEVTD